MKFKLNPGLRDEYKRRHDELWPELKDLLKQSGVEEYSIFLDEETNILFAVLDITNEEAMKELPSTAVMKKWWAYMKDVMETNPDNSPVSVELDEMFYLK